MQWLLSETGQGYATWLSALVSVLAIVIALVVALIEQRRSHADQVREIALQREDLERRDRESATAKARYIKQCAELIDVAARLLDFEIPRLESQSFVTWNRYNGIPSDLLPMRSSLRALQLVPQDDPAVVLTLSRAIQVLDELVDAPIAGAPAGSSAAGYVKPRLEQLLRYRHGLLALSPE